ncbi:MAG: HlyD family efflux transporter periplasmic adaptor subunit [Spirochaetes bacterium]|nr:HlyD family efflux transporter periplasmic adaptor subunit [Spirochaetota bacterium]
MKERIIKFDELSDSREMLETRPPKIMSFFIYIILFMFLAAFLWMWFGKIEIVVKANGIIRPTANISLVRNITSGKIKEIRFFLEKNVKKGDLLFSIDSGALEIEKESVNREFKEVKSELAGFSLLKDSFNKGRSLMPEKNIKFYNKYLQYQFKKESLRLSLIKAENAYRKETELPPDMVAAVRLEELKSEYLFSKLSLEAWESENRLSVEEQIQSLKQRKNTIIARLQKINYSLENCIVRAPISGRIQEVGTYNPGDFIPSGTEILRIIPDKGKSLKIELFVRNKDIANIEKGSKVYYSFAALPRREYGYLTGSVTKIPGDIRTISGAEGGVFIVDADIKRTVLIGKRKSVRVRIGMICEGRIIVREQRILDFVLEKLDFTS